MSLAPHQPARPTRDLSRPLPATLSWTVLIVFVAVFAAALVVLALPWWMPALYAVMSLIAFTAYGIDKTAAQRGWRRVPERALLTLGLVCGWPGALLAQQLFRHKTRKRSFRRSFWRTVVVNVLVLVALVTVATMRGWSLALPWLNVAG